MDKIDPFQVKPLPKAFYYPSKEKDLTKKEKKVCLSVPSIPQQQQKVTSPEDLKFLKDTNAVQEIPTRENGSFADQSSTSQFNESWPSTTEPTGSLGTPMSDGSISSPEMSQQMREWLSGTDKPVTKSTLGWYINRFRNAPPSSRQIRDKSSFTNQKQGDFWWLSPPSGQSTPVVDTPPEKLKPSPSKGTAKKTNKLPASTSSPISVHSSDKSMEDLNKRAKELLERSETSIDSISTEPFPLPLKKPVLPKTRTPETITRASSTLVPCTKFTTLTNTTSPTITHQNPWPEDDILYQWRLARKMEKAQERASTLGGRGRPLGIPSNTQRLLNTGDHIRRAFDNDGSAGLHLLQHHSILHTPSTEHPKPFAPLTMLDSHIPVCTHTTTDIPPVGEVSHVGSVTKADDSTSTILASKTPVCTSTTTDMASAREVSHIVTTASMATRPIMTPFVSPPCRHESTVDNNAGVPPHMHLSCDILPCPCSETEAKHSVRTELLQQRPCRQDSNFNTNGRKESQRTPEQKSSVQQETVGSEMEGNHPKSLVDTTEQPDCVTKKPPDEHENEKKEQIDKINSERDRNYLKDSKSFVRTNKGQPSSNSSLDGSRKTDAMYKMKGRRRKNNKTSDMVDNIIGKVVSEHLFSGNMSSDEDISCSTSTESQQEKEDTEHKGESTTPQECLLTESSEEEFAEDEILKMLRQRTRDLKTQLREIDQLVQDDK